MQQGKARRTTQTLEAGVSVGELFQHSEDLLTSTVFERLGYLPGPLAWELLCKTFPGLPVRRMVNIRSIEFWPRWDWNGDQRKRLFVEPDVVFGLDLGDPAQKTVLIIEVKTGAQQQFSQWEDQIKAALSLGDYEDFEILFASLGGLKGIDPNSLWQKIDPNLRKRIKYYSHAEWQDLGRAVGSIKRDDNAVNRLISAIEEVLAIYGYRVTNLSDSLRNLEHLRMPESALATLALGEKRNA